MRKTIILVVIVLFAFSSAGTLLSTKNDTEGEKFEKALDTYFDEYWKFYPTAATLAGYHAYDAKLEDFSEKNLEKRHEALDEFNQTFVAKIDKSKLSPEHQVDHDIIRDAIDFELFRHESLVPWEYNPVFYNEIFINSIRSLFAKEFAPIANRAKNAAERMSGLPKLIKQAKSILKTPPQLFTETAIKQISGIIDYYRNELPTLIETTPPEYKSKMQENLPKIISALTDYQTYLENELLPKSTGNFRLGPTAHPRQLRLTLQNDIPLQELISNATADFNNIRMEMFFTCVPFYKIMEPKIDLLNPPAGLTKDQLYDEVISHVMNRIKRDHASREDFIEKVKTYAGDIKQFLSENQLIEIPEENFEIQSMPSYAQGVTWSRSICLGAYETSGDIFIQVSPIPQDWDEEQTNSFLEEYNNSFLYFWTARKIYPGKLVPLCKSRKNSSLVRNLYPNMSLIESWPVFIEEMLVKSGFGHYDLRLRLNQLKNLLKAVIDFQLELNIHSGTMTEEQALQYMIIRGFQTKSEAERNWTRIILKPSDAANAYVGYTEISKMQEEYKKLKGEAYSDKEFLQKLLSYGAIPLRHLKVKMREE